MIKCRLQMRKHEIKGRDRRGRSRVAEADSIHAFNGPVIEHENLFGSAVKRHKLTEHLEIADSVHRIHHNPSIAKHRHRDSQFPRALDL